MNERIEQLALQARKKSMGDSWCYATPSEFEQKFAELIIAECCQYLSDEISRLNEYRTALEREPQRNELFIDNVDVCIDKCQDNILGLREHFGVKE